MWKSQLLAAACLALLVAGACTVAEGPPSEGPRYVDQWDGTVKDTHTGLVWLKKADCLGNEALQNAMEAAAGLEDLPPGQDSDCGLSDGSNAGDWRLPTNEEWRAMIKPPADPDNPDSYCIPAISDDQGTGCYMDQSSFIGVQPRPYWSSSVLGFSYVANLNKGKLGHAFKNLEYYVWPVRGGQ